MTTIRTSAARKEPYIPEPKAKEELIGGTDKTDGGKEIEIIKEETFGMYRINFPRGGEMPKELQGMFTSVDKAQTAINTYKLKKKSK